MKTWRFVTIMLTAVALSAALAHLMELPGKMTYDADLYARLHRAPHPASGWVEALALASVVGLVWVVRKRGAGTTLPVTALVCQVAAMAVFLAVVQPADRTMAGWSPDTIPADWTNWRDRWEYGHAARAVLELVALAALVLSVVRETPSATTREAKTRPSDVRTAAYSPRFGPNSAVICTTPSEGLRLVFLGKPEKGEDNQ